MQSGGPSDSKPMAEVGFGCSEIRVRDSRGALDDYGVYYVEGAGDTLFVLREQH